MAIRDIDHEHSVTFNSLFQERGGREWLRASSVFVSVGEVGRDRQEREPTTSRFCYSFINASHTSSCRGPEVITITCIMQMSPRPSKVISSGTSARDPIPGLCDPRAPAQPAKASFAGLSSRLGAPPSSSPLSLSFDHFFSFQQSWPLPPSSRKICFSSLILYVCPPMGPQLGPVSTPPPVASGLPPTQMGWGVGGFA